MPPQVVDGAVARERELGALAPDLADRLVANIAARIFGGRQRRAPLDRTVRFEADGVLAGVAADPVSLAIGSPSPQPLIGTEITDVIAGDDAQSSRAARVVELGQGGHQLEDLVRLEQELGVLDGIAHRDRELKLPPDRAGLDNSIHDLRELRHRQHVDLCVGADLDAVRLEQRDRTDRR